jgi:hypothetical protein
VVRNATVGRGLARLADRAGLRVCSVDATAVTFTDAAAAAAILLLPQVAERAVGAGFLEPAAAWLRTARHRAHVPGDFVLYRRGQAAE